MNLLRRYMWRAVVVVLLLVAAVCFVSARYKTVHFGDATIDEILFYFNNGFTNGQSGSIIDAFWAGAPHAVGLFGIFLLPTLRPIRQWIGTALTRIWSWLRRRPTGQPWRFRLRHQMLYASAICLVASWQLLQSFSIPAYIRALNQSTDLYEQHYVNPASARLQFPEQKRNLIYIYLESVENTVMSRRNGGQLPKSAMPELERLALTHASFSHRPSGLGGARMTTGATWTVGGMVAQSGGIPLKDGGVLGRDRNSLGDFKKFIPGAVTIGDILKQQGYQQTFIMGSEASFGGRDKLLQQHGDYQILDYPAQQRRGKLPPDYKVWWGYEDKRLFQFAREEATRLAAAGKPFNLQLLTADTHFTDGWLDETCPTPFEDKYSNVHACSSRQVAQFVSWLKKQPFYQNTTIVISGDHLGMQTDYYHRHITDQDYQRTVFNVFINPAVTTQRTHNRQFSAFDMYPSTLAAMGVKIEGERLGLGVNLFSAESTLAERIGTDKLNGELSRRSSFYESHILGGR